MRRVGLDNGPSADSFGEGEPVAVDFEIRIAFSVVIVILVIDIGW